MKTLLNAALLAFQIVALSAQESAVPPAAAPANNAALSREEAARATAAAWQAYSQDGLAERKAELDKGVINAAGHSMRIWFTEFGAKPERGHALFISMHGGGSAPAEVNEQQFENQKRLYKPAEGYYLVPRAPTDSWNMWHQAPLDALLERTIQNMVLCHGVDPERVYIMGYSAGGDGVYQLGPRLADHWAAAAMMAGHPNEARPDNLRNIGFALHMGAEDGAFSRNKVAAEWGEKLDALAAQDHGAYKHVVKLHAGMGHWMKLKDAEAVPWMAAFRRNMRPERVVWLQDDVLRREFYWLAQSKPQVGARCVVQRKGQEFCIEQWSGCEELTLRLDDALCDLDKPVIIRAGDTVLHDGVLPRRKAVIESTLAARGDRSAIFCAELTVKLPAPLAK